MQKAFADAWGFCQQHDSFLVVSHENPDGDAIGSTFAVMGWLHQMGKRVVGYNVHGIPDSLQWMPRPFGLVLSPQLPDRSAIQAVVIVDVGNARRVSPAFEGWLNRSPLLPALVIDHHASTTAWAQVTVLDVPSSSTCELLWQWWQARPSSLHSTVEITHDIGLSLYTGLVIDTGCFHHSNVREKSFLMAADLVAKGTPVKVVIDQLFHSFPKERLLLYREVLSTVRFPVPQVASAYITQEMFQKTGANPDMIEHFSNSLLDVKEVQVACLIREKSDGSIKISLRSKTTSVLSVVEALGGGGHHLACGATVVGQPLAKVLEQIEASLKELPWS